MIESILCSGKLAHNKPLQPQFMWCLPYGVTVVPLYHKANTT